MVTGESGLWWWPAAAEHGEALLCAEVDPAAVVRARVDNPYLVDLRRELFG
jgi:predicted amidohydrolase